MKLLDKKKLNRNDSTRTAVTSIYIGLGWNRNEL